MGTWGAGNFDSDTAADHLSIVTDTILREITTAFEDRAKLEPDEYMGVAVPCNIELLTLLAKQKYVGVALPDAATLSAWKKIYLEVWDGKIDGLAPNPLHAKKRDEAAIARYLAWKKKRRAVLVRTFDALARCIAREEDG